MKKVLGLFAVPLKRVSRLVGLCTVLAVFILGSSSGFSKGPRWWCPSNSFGPGESISCVWWNASSCGGDVCVMEICFDPSTQEDDIGIRCQGLAFACVGEMYSGCT